MSYLPLQPHAGCVVFAKVDGAYAAVKFHTRDGDFGSSSKEDLLMDCRLLRKDDLQVSMLYSLDSCPVW